MRQVTVIFVKTKRLIPMSWGYRVTLLYCSFVALIITLVVISVRQDDIHLVSKDYYKEEIAYQDQINKMNNVKRLQGKLGFTYTGEKGEVLFSFPDQVKGATGEIVFFRPSDARKDVKVSLRMQEDNTQVVNVQQLDRGLWKVKIYFNANGQEFYDEQVLVL
jgi:hypothetical protein